MDGGLPVVIENAEDLESLPSSVSFFVAGLPSPAGSKRGFVRGGKVIIVDANPASRSWKEACREGAITAMNGRPPTREPVALRLTFSRTRPKSHFDTKGRVKERCAGAHPTSKPDALKLGRGVEDALSGIVYCDDSQVVTLHVVKCFGDRPGVEVEASWLPG